VVVVGVGVLSTFGDLVVGAFVVGVVGLTGCGLAFGCACALRRGAATCFVCAFFSTGAP
jgi:hypothetical protein